LISTIKKHIQDSIAVKEKILSDGSLLNAVEKVVKAIVTAYRQEKKVIIFGNGGSAADAQHIAGEFVGRFYKERKALPALALHANTSVVTALANDYGYDTVFARQVEAYAVAGDVVIGISTSGNSPNVITAIQKAKDKGAVTVGFTGGKASKLFDVADICLRVPSLDTPRIQEAHITLGHIICFLVEETLFPS
jgi:D-sedoheptulose 7-phosphate isomerase